MAETRLLDDLYFIRPLLKKLEQPYYLNFDGTNSQWNIAPVKDKSNTYTIKHSNHKSALALAEGDQKAYLSVQNDEVQWEIKPSSTGYFSFTVAGKENIAVEVDVDNKDKVPLGAKQPNDTNQLWMFEKVDKLPSPPGTFTTEFFPLTARKAAEEDYDIIVVGSGVGGLVRTTQKKVLLLEREGLTFHSHCLNTARPVDLVKDRGQHNDFFFHRFWGKFDIVKCCDKCADRCGGKNFDWCCNESSPKCCDECCNKPATGWNGGPMYNLGGRSAAWGLFIPRIHDRTLEKHFPKVIKDELLATYYSKAERLMNLSLPRTEKMHRHVIDRLNADGLAAVPNSRVQWNWARIASEFQPENNYNFAQGAYSSIDKILEIALGKENEGVGRTKADPNVQIALNSEVQSLIMDWSKTPPIAIGVNVRTLEGDCVPIYLKDGGNVVLSAGSVDSAAILLRSGGDDWRKKIQDHRALQVTDHDIYIYGSSFRYTKPMDRELYGPMKLQSYLNMNDEPTGPVGLANMSIDSSSFLPRGVAEDSKIPNFIMAFIRECKLHNKNTIEIDSTTFKPQVTIRRGERATEKELDIMVKLTCSAMDTIKRALGATFVKDPPTSETLYLAPLGVVAHELGTLPMKDPGSEDSRACLDDDLKIVGDICNGVYVCDLACFPFSPEVNPTLTLAALAIRLSRTLVDRTRVTASSGKVCVVNHSGATVRIRVSNLAQKEIQAWRCDHATCPCTPPAPWVYGLPTAEQRRYKYEQF
ncbi:coatomer subunit beta [Rhizoctonia solani]|uniref:Coatomer subunit beta n=1 Tax=Rhizoctonia solani TaxID=456999 RepID=A0A0K6GF45_9AGAM|nr:coatomer subunit beta [Rhizoctonia solani]